MSNIYFQCIASSSSPRFCSCKYIWLFGFIFQWSSRLRYVPRVFLSPSFSRGAWFLLASCLMLSRLVWNLTLLFILEISVWNREIKDQHQCVGWRGRRSEFRQDYLRGTGFRLRMGLLSFVQPADSLVLGLLDLIWLGMQRLTIEKMSVIVAQFLCIAGWCSLQLCPVIPRIKQRLVYFRRSCQKSQFTKS